MNVPATICVLTAATFFSSGLVVAQTDGPRVERPVYRFVPVRSVVV
jgi:hypothetical protein